VSKDKGEHSSLFSLFCLLISYRRNRVGQRKKKKPLKSMT
jgi:hypothetical protein